MGCTLKTLHNVSTNRLTVTLLVWGADNFYSFTGRQWWPLNRSGLGPYAGAARRRMQFATLFFGRRYAGPVMPLRGASTWRNHEACGRPLGMVQPLGSREDRIRLAGSSLGSRATCPQRRSRRSGIMQITCNSPASLSTSEPGLLLLDRTDGSVKTWRTVFVGWMCISRRTR